MKYLLILTALVTLSASSRADEKDKKIVTGTNPVITGQFTADPTARVFCRKSLYPPILLPFRSH